MLIITDRSDPLFNSYFNAAVDRLNASMKYNREHAPQFANELGKRYSELLNESGNFSKSKQQSDEVIKKILEIDANKETSWKKEKDRIIEQTPEEILDSFPDINAYIEFKNKIKEELSDTIYEYGYETMIPYFVKYHEGKDNNKISYEEFKKLIDEVKDNEQRQTSFDYY